MKKSITNAVFPNRVSEIRKEHGLTQQELADRLYLDKNTISRIENGMNFTLENLVRISDLFGVSLDYIMLRSESRKSAPTDVDAMDTEIIAELKNFSASEKERLLKHLALENALKLTTVG
ncbi:MAG: helix-turn-helix domain-containing protein [Lachnospiraceae bacterium]|nr:helix-turn-helix domain-containing protein [Ruminococcus sp.]MCM1276409.1 helix-turn-helix domain-containing protein [Lachnospiraceae bacterium]